MKFVKMHGAGNDYIYFDCIAEPFPADPVKTAVVLSDRHFGIGGDGIVLIMPSDIADFRMRIFNADGSEGKMCGNASRCIGKYLYENGYTDKKEILLETASGIKRLFVSVNGGIAVSTDMGRVSFSADDVPVVLPEGSDGLKVRGVPAVCLSVGNPHCVIFVSDAASYPLSEAAAELAESGFFPEGVNFEIAELTADGIKARVFERGSGETLACGTGACAIAAAAVKLGLVNSRSNVPVLMPGGLLRVSIEENGTAVLSGPAVTVFTGETPLI